MVTCLTGLESIKKPKTVLFEAASLSGGSDKVLATKTMILLVWVIGYNQARYEDGLLLGRTVAVMLDNAGGDEQAFVNAAQ